MIQSRVHVPTLLRGFSLLLASIAALAGVSPAQVSFTTPDKPSQADCAAAISRGGSVPPGCTPDSSSGSLPTRQPSELAPVQPPQLIPGRTDAPEQFTLVPLNPSQRKKVELPVRPETEFEQAVADTVGRALPLFGQSLFAEPPSTFAPTDRSQVQDDYIVGPDDELQIRIWGQVNADLRVVVDRAGQIYIPRVGPVAVAGVRYRDLQQHLKSAVLKFYRNFDLTVAIGRIRSIQIYVVGQARYPGTYTISSLSTLVNAVFASGGPTPQGSLRDVQLQREGRTIAHMDLYELLVNGDKSKDVALRSGDVLYFPPVGPLVAVAGSVNTPAIYEVKTNAQLSELIEIAGGLSTMADSNKVVVERISDTKIRSVLEFPLDEQARALPLRDGDIVRVLSIVPRFGDAVTLRGNVVNPGRYPWRAGMRVRDLIPNAQALTTRSYWLDRAAITDARSTEYPIEDTQDVGDADPRTKNSDPMNSDQKSRNLKNRQRTLRREPGQVVGQQKPNSENLTQDLHRAAPEINWSYAIIQRVDPVNLSTKLLSFDLGKAVLEGDPASNLELQADDIITIFAQSDVAVPQIMRTRYIRVEGEVVRAGVYKVEEGELLRDVIRRAGGITPQAYIYGTELTRESARAQQQKSLDELTRSLELDVRQASVAAATRTNPEDSQLITARLAAQEALIAQLRGIRASGRVVLDLKPTATSINAYPALTVEDNDRIVVPHMPSTVSVTGMVYNPGSFVYNPRRNVGDYLKVAGKGKPNSDMHHAFVLRADGSVVARKEVNNMFEGDHFSKLRLYPGDQIVVPNKIPTGALVRGLRDWTQITSQLAITGAALAVIH